MKLGRELGRTVPELLRTMSSSEITEHMAYDSLQDKDWRERLEAEMRKEKQAALSAEERAQQFMRFFRTRTGAAHG